MVTRNTSLTSRVQEEGLQDYYAHYQAKTQLEREYQAAIVDA